MTSKKTGRRISGDPRKTGGDIAGPGGPHDANSVIIDPANAVLLDHSTVSLVGSPNEPRPQPLPDERGRRRRPRH